MPYFINVRITGSGCMHQKLNLVMNFETGMHRDEHKTDF